MFGNFQREDGWCESLWNKYGSSLGVANRTEGNDISVGFDGIPPLSKEAVLE